MLLNGGCWGCGSNVYVPLKSKINTDGYTCNVYDLSLSYCLVKYLSYHTVK